jgi:RNA polymerase sporulation-specific sigma factor
MAPEEPPQGLLEELVERYLQGDGQAGEQLLSHPMHRQKVEILARRHATGTSVLWEEAAQEAHLKVLQAARSGSFRQGGAREFYSWAARVAENAIIDTVRREKRKLGGRRLKSLDEHLPETDMTLGESIADDSQKRLSDAVAGAGSRKRRVSNSRSIGGKAA